MDRRLVGQGTERDPHPPMRCAGDTAVVRPQPQCVACRSDPHDPRYSPYGSAREVRPPVHVENAIEGIVALLRGEPADLSEIALDTSGIQAFSERVYAFTRTIPHGETLTYGEIATKLRVSGAVRSVTQALARNPFVIIVPCHRVLEAGGYADNISPNGGAISKRRLLSIEGARGKTTSKTLFEVLLPVAPTRPPG